MRALIDQLFTYEAWACRRVLASLSQPGVPAKALLIFSHLLTAQQVWLQRITGKVQQLPLWETYPMEEMGKVLERYLRDFSKFAESLPEGDFQKKITYINSEGNRYATPLSQILIHLSHHSAYHRGQIALLLREANLQPPITDFIAFSRSL